jgi:glycosyltransferase involved in cell wall biosynthesis
MNVTAIVTCMTEAELPFVREAIYSVQTQTCACELLVIVPEDNATILSYFRGFGSAFTLYPVPMYRAGIVRNLGVARATTEWVAFLDGDDVWTPTKTERQLVVARETGSPFIGTRHLLIREDGTPFFYAFAKRMPMPSSWLVKRDLLVEDPFFDRSGWEDVELWNRIEGKGVRTYTLKDYCVHYRVRHVSNSTRYAPKHYNPKHRKDRFAKMSTIVGMRPALLISSRVWSLLNPPLNTRRSRAIK